MIEVPGATLDDEHVIDDPLLGRAHVITSGGQTTTVTAIDWARPARIPTIAAPAKLAPGAGGALMNLLATRAREAGVAALRYAGRYPTAALFRTLCRSFRTTATEEDFTSHFRLLGDEVEIPIDFVPAPHARIAHAHGLVELRAGIERAVVDGIGFEIDGSPGRLVAAGGGAVRAEVWFGDACYAHVATFDGEGRLVAGPHPIPACGSEVIGKPFPAPLVAALAELVAEAVPAPLAEDARQYLVGRTLRWADLGARPAADDAVHAILWERIAPLGLARLALALAEALAPVVVGALVRDLTRDIGLLSPPA